MGSKLTRQRSTLDVESKLSKRKRQTTTTRHDDSPGGGEAERSAGMCGGDFLFTSLVVLNKSDKKKLPGMQMLRKTNDSPYLRRVAWIRQIQSFLREQRGEQASEVLKMLRKDLGLQGTSLNDILYKNPAFLNLVDPISHELLLSLAQDIQCPKKETDSLKSANKICKQLIYHLTPHSKWTRQNVPRRKAQACLKSTLKKRPPGDVVNLSGMPLCGRRDLRHVAHHIQGSSGDDVEVSAVDLSFTELQDEGLRLLLPVLGRLPKLTRLAVNGNRLTVAVLKDLTDYVKDHRNFPSLAWVDLGNNVDIFTVPQPLLVALRRRFGLRSSLPTIYEYGETVPRTAATSSVLYVPNLETSVEEASLCEDGERRDEEQRDGDDEEEEDAG